MSEQIQCPACEVTATVVDGLCSNCGTNLARQAAKPHKCSGKTCMYCRVLADANRCDKPKTGDGGIKRTSSL
jgi:hypothetical protein